MEITNRRRFVKSTLVAGMGAGMGIGTTKAQGNNSEPTGTRIGIIGLDTSHSVAFTKTLNGPDSGSLFGGYKVVAAYPRGSNDILSSVERIPGYTEEVKKYGVSIVDSIEDLLKVADVVMLETNDGRLHLEQALPVLKAGKRMFIDKPMAASLSDAMLIFNAAKKYDVPVFSSSSLRYLTGIDEIQSGILGKVIGAETYSPAKLEKTHPDLFWYGIHGVETLFTLMGTGCKSVVRVSNADVDLVTGTWADNRVGTFRGIRKGASDYGGTVFGEKGIKNLGSYAGYNPLLLKIIDFFKTGITPVSPEETIEILAFMEAADWSKTNGGTPVDLEAVLKKAALDMQGRVRD